MAQHMNDRLVHYYDTGQHRVLCGASMADDHSTKHVRGITCATCIALLRERAGVAQGQDVVESPAAGP